MKGCLYTEMNKNVSHTCVRVILRLQWLRRRKNLTFQFRNEPDLRVMYRHAPVSMSAKLLQYPAHYSHYLGLVCYTSMFKVYILTNLLVKKINLTSSKTEYTVYGQNLEKTKRIFFLNCQIQKMFMLQGGLSLISAMSKFQNKKEKMSRQ